MNYLQLILIFSFSIERYLILIQINFIIFVLGELVEARFFVNPKGLVNVVGYNNDKFLVKNKKVNYNH